MRGGETRAECMEINSQSSAASSRSKPKKSVVERANGQSPAAQDDTAQLSRRRLEQEDVMELLQARPVEFYLR